MIKRFLGISIILLANLILLAHNAIPHHHHQHKVCLVSSHCHSGESTSQDHESKIPTHEHDSPNGDETCTLKQFEAVPPNQLRLNAGENDAVNFIDPGIHIESSGNLQSDCSFIKTGHLFIFPLIPYNNLPAYYISSCGLRAPPIV